MAVFWFILATILLGFLIGFGTLLLIVGVFICIVVGLFFMAASSHEREKSQSQGS